MGFFKAEEIAVAQIAAPTLEDRHDQLSRRAEAALGIFHHAATELEIAADELDKIAAEAQAIVERHQAVQEAADDEAETNRRNAAKIRNLFN